MSEPIKEEEEIAETDNAENPENPDQEVNTKLDAVELLLGSETINHCPNSMFDSL